MKTIFERVIDYNSACVELNITPDTNAGAIKKIRTIAKALNEGEVVNSENGYYPAFDWSGEGWSLYGVIDFWYGCSAGWVALVTSREKGEHLGKICLDLYKEVNDYNNLDV